MLPSSIAAYTDCALHAKICLKVRALRIQFNMPLSKLGHIQMLLGMLLFGRRCLLIPWLVGDIDIRVWHVECVRQLPICAGARLAEVH